MHAIAVGTKCARIAGRKAGEKVTVTKVIDSNYVEVQGEKGKPKRVNVKHLEPL
jgi:ribosomal protein L14E/L6E/L27E